MTNINEAYLKFINLVNRNATNNNISVDKPRFIILFNTVLNKYVEWVLEKRNEDAIRYVAPLLSLEVPLELSSKKEKFDEFKLPTNYFDLANLHVYAENGKCKNQRMTTFEAKIEDVEELLNDENNKPSFEFRETFYLTSNKNAVVYKDGFSINKVLLSYYRYPVQVDISGYTRIDGTPSQDINPELDDKAIDRVLVAMSKEFSANNGDTAKYQLDKDRLFTEI